MSNNLFSGQGKILVAPILASGLAGQFRWIGNVPDFTLSFDATSKKLKEAHSGQRLPLATMTTENTAKVAASLNEFSKDNLALAVRGQVTAGASGTVTAGQDNSPSDLTVGGIWALKHQNITAAGFTVTDSAGSPVTVDPAHIKLDPVFGTVTLLNAASYMLPLKAAYAYTASAGSVAFFTESIKSIAIRFEGINTADNNRKVLAEIYNVAMDPTKELGLILDDFGVLKLEGLAQLDPTKDTSDPVFGPFGRLTYIN